MFPLEVLFFPSMPCLFDLPLSLREEPLRVSPVVVAGSEVVDPGVQPLVVVVVNDPANTIPALPVVVRITLGEGFPYRPMGSFHEAIAIGGQLLLNGGMVHEPFGLSIPFIPFEARSFPWWCFA